MRARKESSKFLSKIKRYHMKAILVTKVLCERMDCKHWVDGECAKKEIKIKERTIPPEEEIAVCSAYEKVAAFC